jgi:hypothetical protein
MAFGAQQGATFELRGHVVGESGGSVLAGECGDEFAHALHLHELRAAGLALREVVFHRAGVLSLKFAVEVSAQLFAAG